MVADVAAVETRAPRPVQVSWAVRLFWLDVALSIVQSVLMLAEGSTDRLSQLLAGVVTFALIAFEAWVIYKISIGRNWARWVSLVSVLLGVLEALRGFPSVLATSPAVAALEGVTTVVDVVALYLLFVSPGRKWFRPSPAV